VGKGNGNYVGNGGMGYGRFKANPLFGLARFGFGFSGAHGLLKNK
jgi:hypothetical protein